MQYIMSIALILSSWSILCDTQPSVIIHNHNYYENNNRTVQNISAQMEQRLSMHNEVTNLSQLASSAREHAQEYTYSLFSWMNQHKLKTALYASAIGYGYVWYKLLSLNYALTQTNRWSCWHETISLEELLAKPQNEVATDLLTAIQRHYTTPEQFDDLIGPLIAFVRDVDAEIDQLQQIRQLHTWIDRLRISFLFPKQSNLLDDAQSKIHRLSYLKNILLTWVSHHKVSRLSQTPNQ